MLFAIDLTKYSFDFSGKTFTQKALGCSKSMSDLLKGCFATVPDTLKGLMAADLVSSVFSDG